MLAVMCIFVARQPKKEDKEKDIEDSFSLFGYEKNDGEKAAMDAKFYNLDNVPMYVL